MKGDFHARFYERRRVRLRPPTHLEAYPRPADRLPQAERGEDNGELGRGVVAAPVGVEDRTGLENMIPCRHGDRRRDERVL